MMSAFGKKAGIGAALSAPRRGFGNAAPMRGSRSTPVVEPLPDLDDAPESTEPALELTGDRVQDAMQRLSARERGAAGSVNSQQEGFEASIHKIKEQVLPRLLERVDPEAAATLSKDELSEEFRPIIGEVLAELKLTLNRREQIALEKVLVDELLGLGPLEVLLADPAVSDIMVNGPNQTFIERKGKLELASIVFRDEEHLFQIAQRIVNRVGRRIDQTTPLADARPMAAAST